MDVREELEKVRELLEGGEDDEALARAEGLLAPLGPGVPDDVRADVFWLLADLRGRADRHDGAADAYEEALPLLDRLGRRRDAAVAASNLGFHHAQAGRGERALRWVEESLERHRRIGEQPALLRAHANLGWYRLERGDVAGAESSLRNAVQQARAHGDPRELGTCLLWLGRALLRGGRPDRALIAFTESVAALASTDSPLAGEAEAEVAALRSVPGGAR